MVRRRPTPASTPTTSPPARRALLRRPGAPDGPRRGGPRRDLPHGGTATPQHVGPGAALLPSPVARGERRHRRPHARPTSTPCEALVDDTVAALGRRPAPTPTTARSCIEEIAATAACLRLACADARAAPGRRRHPGSVAAADRAALATELGTRRRGVPPPVARALPPRRPDRQHGLVRPPARLLPQRARRAVLVRALRLGRGRVCDKGPR